MIDKAVEYQLKRVAIAQQNIAAMYVINHRLTLTRGGQNKFAERLKLPSDAYWSVLHEELADAWNGLAYFAPISKEAMEYLTERTKTWFASESAGIMEFLGFEGSYYTKDRDAFRREVLAMFGITDE